MKSFGRRNELKESLFAQQSSTRSLHLPHLPHPKWKPMSSMNCCRASFVIGARMRRLLPPHPCFHKPKKLAWVKRRKLRTSKMKQFLANINKLETKNLIFLQNASIKLFRRLQVLSKFCSTPYFGGRRIFAKVQGRLVFTDPTRIFWENSKLPEKVSWRV